MNKKHILIEFITANILMMFDLMRVFKVGYRYLISNKKYEIHLTKIAS